MQIFVNDHRDYLKRELNLRIKRRPFYSQRAFARDLGLSPSTLVEYLNGKLILSTGRVSLLGKKIGLSKEQKQHWVDLIELNQRKRPEIKKISQLRVKARLQAQKSNLSVEQFAVISDWFYLAFLELLEMDRSKYSNLLTSAKALNISSKEMNLAATRLISLGLIEKDESGAFKVKSETQVSNDVPSVAIKNFHQQIITKAKEAVLEQDIDQRFLSSTMISLPQDKVKELLGELHLAAFKILSPYIEDSSPSALSEGRDTDKESTLEILKPNKDKLYCLSIQFFNLLKEVKSAP